MSIRISLYDFFAYTRPGISYLIVLGLWAIAFRRIQIDASSLNSLSLLALFLLVGGAYITGLLLDALAYRWVRLFQQRNRDAAQAAFDEFHRQHPWVNLSFRSTDWGILLRAIRSKSLEEAVDVEQHNVAAIMLRNISLSLLFAAISFFVFFFALGRNGWDLLLGSLLFILSIIAMQRGRLRRHWFYTALFEAYAAYFLLDEGGKNQVKPSLVPAKKSAARSRSKKTDHVP